MTYRRHETDQPEPDIAHQTSKSSNCFLDHFFAIDRLIDSSFPKTYVPRDTQDCNVAQQLKLLTTADNPKYPSFHDTPSITGVKWQWLTRMAANGCSPVGWWTGGQARQVEVLSNLTVHAVQYQSYVLVRNGLEARERDLLHRRNDSRDISTSSQKGHQPFSSRFSRFIPIPCTFQPFDISTGMKSTEFAIHFLNHSLILSWPPPTMLWRSAADTTLG